MAKKRSTKTPARSKHNKPSGFGNADATQEARARQALAIAARSARALMEFRTPAAIIADESDLDPFLQAVEKLAQHFGKSVDMEREIMEALGTTDMNDKRLRDLHDHHCDMVLASQLSAFAIGVACGRQGGAR